jgi:hypothetical protein
VGIGSEADQQAFERRSLPSDATQGNKGSNGAQIELCSLQLPNLRVMLPPHQGYQQNAIQLHKIVHRNAGSQFWQNGVDIRLNIKEKSVDLKLLSFHSHGMNDKYFDGN